MVFPLQDFPANTTLQPIPDLILLTEHCLNPSLFCFVIHTTLWSITQMNSLPIFTASYLTLALASNISSFFTSSPSPKIPFFPITHQYHICHSSPHTRPLFFPFMVFERRHNFPNLPVSTVIPSPSSFRDITTIGTYQHLGEILKDAFSYIFSRQYCIQINTAQTNITLSPPSIGFHSCSQELVYMYNCNKFFCSLLT